MERISGIDRDDLIEQLGNAIFVDPTTEHIVSNAEYLSGNVVKKLEIAREKAATDDSFKKNVEALEGVQPHKIDADDIEVHIGAAWIPEKFYTEFMYELFETPDEWRVARLNNRNHEDYRLRKQNLR